MPHIFFYLGLSLMLLHEMDAVRCKEWRIFPGLSLLSDNWGFGLFMFAHIPLLYWIFFELSQTNIEFFIIGFDCFMLAHLGFHLLFLLHKENEFRDWISWTIICGAASCGLLDLWLS